MHYATAKAIMVAETTIIRRGMNQLISELGVPNWTTDAAAEAEELIEVGGRLCYKSFDVSLNGNLTKVREGNHNYLGNVLSQKHGSVFEHSTTTFVLLNVSRILTHELVRHRAGAAYSQESMRFVRLDDLGMYDPQCMTPEFLQEFCAPYVLGEKNPSWGQNTAEWLRVTLAHHVYEAEKHIRNAVAYLGLDNPKMPFHIKKMLTSALRRWAPGGLTTNIMVTCNHRAWRHMIENRTAGGAEEEIRIVFYSIAQQMAERYPAIYQDMQEVPLPPPEDYVPQITFRNSKI